MKFKFLFSAWAILSSTLFAAIQLEPLHQLKTGPIVAATWIQTSEGKKLVAVSSSDQTLKVWNLRSEQLENTLTLPRLTSEEYWRIENVSENPWGELVAILGKYHGVANAGSVLAVNIDEGTLLELGTTDIGAPVAALRTNAKNNAVAVSLSHQLSLGNWTSTYVALDTSSLSILGKLDTDFSGDVHLYLSKHAEVRAVIGGYETVALWDPKSGQVTKLVNHVQPSQWPTLLTDPSGQQLLQLNDGDDTVLYSYESLTLGQLVIVKRLPLGKKIVAVGERDWVIKEEITNGASLPLTTTIRLSSYEDGHLIGELPVGLGRVGLVVSRLGNGEYIGWASGPKNPDLFVSPSTVLLGNFNQGKILFSHDYKGNIQMPGLKQSESGNLFGTIQAVGSFPDSTTVFGLPSGKILSDSGELQAMTGLLRFPDGNVGSLMGVTTTGEVCFFDWSADQAVSCFAPGTFVKEGLPYWYYELDSQAMERGEEFVVPIITNTDPNTPRTTGFRSFRLAVSKN